MSAPVAFVVIQSVPFEGYRTPIAVALSRDAAERVRALIGRATYESGYEIIECPLIDDGLTANQRGPDDRTAVGRGEGGDPVIRRLTLLAAVIVWVLRRPHPGSTACTNTQEPSDWATAGWFG